MDRKQYNVAKEALIKLVIAEAERTKAEIKEEEGEEWQVDQDWVVELTQLVTDDLLGDVVDEVVKKFQ